MGLSADLVDQMAKTLEWWDRGTIADDQLKALGLDPANGTIRRTVDLTAQLLGFPRHLSQHVGGMVMTRRPLCEMVPIENASMEDRTVIEWDKDDIDALGILKVDVLGLGMLTCISKCLNLINDREASNVARASRPCLETSEKNESTSADISTIADTGETPVLQLHTIPPEDPAVYDMIGNADTIGVFQIESRAQMSMLPRLRPRCFYDLVIEVAIVRPGPIQGNMVHPYLRRRNNEEPVSYPSEPLRQVLSKTLGVPLFQEQAMRIAMVGAGFTAEEADKLRRAMAAWHRHGGIDLFHKKIVDGMLANGYTREFAEQCFLQIRGFGEYGFPESHAASFALLVYVSAWLKRYHPAAFAAALLNSQPMGFYAPAQIVRDARDHGVEVRPVDINASYWDCTLEEEKGSGFGVQCTENGDVASLSHSDTGETPVPLDAHPWHGRLARVAADRNPDDINRDAAASSSHPSPHGHSGPALRLGFRRIKGLQTHLAQQLIDARTRVGRFTSIPHLHQSTHLPQHAMRRLAEADAFSSLDLSRRQALWQILALHDEQAPLFDDPLPEQNEPDVDLPLMPLDQEVMTDYAKTGHSLKQHPLALVRPQLQPMKVLTAAQLQQMPHGRWVKVAGLVLIRQRPATASGIVFVTLEDETGVVNLIIRPAFYDRYRSAARHAALLAADGYVERQDQVIHVMVKRLYDLSGLIQRGQFSSRDFH